jgi:hypothetical protein
MSYTQVVTLLSGHGRVELRAVLDGFSGHDRLVRLRFPLAVHAGTPLAEVGNAVIARSWGFADQDSAEDPWTLDTPAQNWAGVGATMAAHFVDGHAHVGAQALGVGEVVVPDGVMGGPLGSGVRSLLVALVQKGVTSSCTEAGANRYGNLLGDSNLPDFRISLGKPEESHVTAAALHAGGPGFQAELERQLARHGAVRLWVPASRSLAEAWAPDLDLRAAGDLPVLVVAGVDEAATGRALAALVEDVENGQIVVDQPAKLFALSGGGAMPQAAGCTAAVLNRGTPGFAVDSAGAMYISLLRSCTGWPSGVWIDPPRRTAPDGSNFELEHWSHVFDLALVAGEGDWRSLRCVQEAHDFNTPLLTTVVGPQQGVLPPAASLLHVSGGGPQDRGSIVLSALKPAGNPLAAGRLPGERPGTCPLEITARLYESAGSPATAILRTGERCELEGAWAMNLLEEGEERLPVVERQVAVRLTPAQTRTVRLRLKRAGQEAAVGDRSSGMARAGGDKAGDAQVEVAQPVFSRYWLHNKGPAPMGNQLLAVHLGPTCVRARAGSGETALVATVSSGAAEATQAGRLQIVAPDDWGADPPSRLFNLAAGAYTTVAVRLVVPERTRPGRYFVAARVEDGAGQSQEDVATIDILPSAALNHPADQPAEPAPSFGHPSAQAAAELEAHLTSDHLCVVAGSTAVLGLILANRTRSELRGEAQLVSPWETWALAGPWAQGFSVPPGGQSRVDFTVSVPAGSPPLSSWLLVKAMYFGRLWYSPAVRLDVTPLRRAGGGRP